MKNRILNFGATLLIASASMGQTTINTSPAQGVDNSPGSTTSYYGSSLQGTTGFVESGSQVVYTGGTLQVKYNGKVGNNLTFTVSKQKAPVTFGLAGRAFVKDDKGSGIVGTTTYNAGITSFDITIPESSIFTGTSKLRFFAQSNTPISYLYAGEISIEKSIAVNNAIDVSNTSFSYNDNAGDVSTVNVTSALAWSATADVSWIQVKEKFNDQFYFEITGSNPETISRTGTITVSNGINSKTISISQAGKTVVAPPNNTYLSLNGTNFTVSSSLSTVYVEVASSSNFTVSTGGTSWLIFYVSNANTIVLSAAANTTSNTRNATVTVLNGDNLATTISITQEGVVLPPNPNPAPIDSNVVYRVSNYNLNDRLGMGNFSNQFSWKNSIYDAINKLNPPFSLAEEIKSLYVVINSGVCFGQAKSIEYRVNFNGFNQILDLYSSTLLLENTSNEVKSKIAEQQVLSWFYQRTSSNITNLKGNIELFDKIQERIKKNKSSTFTYFNHNNSGHAILGYKVTINTISGIRIFEFLDSNVPEKPQYVKVYKDGSFSFSNPARNTIRDIVLFADTICNTIDCASKQNNFRLESSEFTIISANNYKSGRVIDTLFIPTGLNNNSIYFKVESNNLEFVGTGNLLMGNDKFISITQSGLNTSSLISEFPFITSSGSATIEVKEVNKPTSLLFQEKKDFYYTYLNSVITSNAKLVGVTNILGQIIYFQNIDANEYKIEQHSGLIILKFLTENGEIVIKKLYI